MSSIMSRYQNRDLKQQFRIVFMCIYKLYIYYTYFTGQVQEPFILQGQILAEDDPMISCCIPLNKGYKKP